MWSTQACSSQGHSMTKVSCGQTLPCILPVCILRPSDSLSPSVNSTTMQADHRRGYEQRFSLCTYYSPPTNCRTIIRCIMNTNVNAPRHLGICTFGWTYLRATFVISRVEWHLHVLIFEYLITWLHVHVVCSHLHLCFCSLLKRLSLICNKDFSGV